MEDAKALELAKAVANRVRTVDPQRADAFEARINAAVEAGSDVSLALFEALEQLSQGPKNLAQQLNIKVGLRMTLKKYEGEYTPDKKPFETLVSEDRFHL